MLRLTDLREILRYVPRFRDKVFVIAIDGAVTEDDNFGNLLLDIALLRNRRRRPQDNGKVERGQRTAFNWAQPGACGCPYSAATTTTRSL